MTDWSAFSPADFDARRADKRAARAARAAAETGQAGLFFVATPTRPATSAAEPERLPGEVALFGDDAPAEPEPARPAECTPEQAAQWQERYTAGYSYGRMDARAGKPRTDVLLAEIPPEDPYETGSVYCARNLDLAFRIAYTRAYRYECARQTGGN